MRVIAGKYKSYNIKSPTTEEIRPTTDRVKESIFNLIQNHVKDRIVLDLFCGTGALGIECISRGARKVYFSDISRKSIMLLNENLEKIEGSYDIFNKSYKNVLAGISDKVDLIFLDPPYSINEYDQLLLDVSKAEILADDGIIVLERNRDERSYKIPFGYYLADSRPYSSTIIDIIKRGHKVIIPGSFDPFTKGHEYLVKKAIEDFASINVVILINPDKKALFSVKKRLSIMKEHLRKYKNVNIDYFDGLTIDYCKKNNVRYIIRGIRNEKDYDYEKKLAVWNYENGNIETLYYYAEDSNISSTKIKEDILLGNKDYDNIL